MTKTTALIVGNGGREHAIAEQVAGAVDTLFVTGTNAGIEAIPNAVSVPSTVDPGDFAVAERVDLTIIGPEQPLVNGLSDQLREAGRRVFGPSQEAAQLEASKLFGRLFTDTYGIPTPRWDFVEDIEDYYQRRSRFGKAEDLVIKADGLAGGKGVVLPDNQEEADATVYGMLRGELYGGAGTGGVLIEERCHGPEVSMFVLSDGTRWGVLPFTQDHKRRNDGDTGPNTGGMGAYTIPEGTIITDRQRQKLYTIAQKSIEGMAAESVPYQGVLYVGAMLAEEYDGDPVVIEYNVRFGDPEAQVLMDLLGENTFDILASTDAQLRESLLAPAKLAGQAALTVCLATRSYPERGMSGIPISGLKHAYDGVSVYHGGTQSVMSGAGYKTVITNGGRVLYVTGRGRTVDEAAQKAYAAIDPSFGGDQGGIHFAGQHYRTDIGHQVRSV